MKRFGLGIVLAFSLFRPDVCAAGVGEASGGGGPDMDLARCDQSVTVFAPAGRATTTVQAWVTDRELTTESRLFKSISYSFVDNQVHFLVGVPKDAFYLQVDTEQTNGVYLGVLTMGRTSKAVSCSFLDDRFRPLATRQVKAEVFFGGKKCVISGQCVGETSGPLPETVTIPLVFNGESGQLEGQLAAEKLIFDSAVVFTWKVTQRRGQPLSLELAISLKNAPNPTVLTLEGSSTMIRLQTPAFLVGKNTLSVWQKVSLTLGKEE